MVKLFEAIKNQKSKLVLAKLSAIQVALNFLVSILVIRKVGVGAELDVYYIAMAVFAFLYSSINWSLASVAAPYLIQHRGENKEGRFFVTVACLTLPLGIFVALTLPLWAEVVFANYLNTVNMATIYTVQAVLVAAFMVDSLLVVFTAYLQEQNRYILFNGAMAAASLVGLLFVYALIDTLGVVAAAYNQLVMKLFILIWMLVIFGKKIKPFVAFDRQMFYEIIRRVKYILMGSLYFKTDEVVEKYIASYLMPGFVSIIGFVQRVYGAFVSVINSVIGVPSMTVFSNFIKDGKGHELRPILYRYIAILSTLSLCAFVGVYWLGEVTFVWVMGDKLPEDMVPMLRMTMYILFSFVCLKPISLVLQSLLLSLNEGAKATAYDAVTFTVTVGLKVGLTFAYGMEGILFAIMLGYILTDAAKFYLVLKELKKLN